MKKVVSPHLGIYKPQISSIFSILHRITGVFLYLGLLVISWLCICYFWSSLTIFSQSSSNLSLDDLLFQPDIMKFLLWNIFGRILVVGWMFCFYYHTCNGIKYLVMDVTHKGYEIKSMNRNAYVVIIISSVFTILTFLCVYY